MNPAIKALHDQLEKFKRDLQVKVDAHAECRAQLTNALVEVVIARDNVEIIERAINHVAGSRRITASEIKGAPIETPADDRTMRPEERMRIHALAAMRKNMPLWKDSNGVTIHAGKVSEVDRASQHDACYLLLVGRKLFHTAHITVPNSFADEYDVHNGGFFALTPDGTFKFFTATAFHAQYQPSETDV